MSLFLHEIVHLMVGVVLGFVVMRITKKRLVLPCAVVASLLIDADHILDYLSTIGPRWDTDALVTGSYFASSGRVMVLLHSWELTAGLIVAGLLSSWKYSGLVLGIGIGMLGHIMIDQVWYAQPWPTYFLTLRWLHGFVDPRLW